MSQAQLRRRVDPTIFSFDSTAELEPLTGTIGQPRATDAIEFGLGIRQQGFNMFVTGLAGSGRLTTVIDHLRRWAATTPVPPDWVYVDNFEHPSQPRAIALPPGRGAALAADMEALVDSLRRTLERAFDSEIYQRHRDELTAEVDSRRRALRHELDVFAAQRGIDLQATPFGVAVVPVRGGRPLAPGQVEELADSDRTELERAGREVQEQFQAHAREVHQLEKDAAERLSALDHGVALAAIQPLLANLGEKYTDLPDVLSHLAAVEADIPEHLAELRREDREREDSPADGLPLPSTDRNRYSVNLLVDNHPLTSAPVIIERNPTYYNLVGRIEYRQQLTTLVADFGQIRAGSLHRANGGVLVLEASDVLRNPFAWEALKRALRAREITVENLTEQLVLIPTPTLRPASIPLDVKVVLIATPLLYQLLQSLDEDVRELFKVKVDFAPEMDWDDEHMLGYAHFIKRCVVESGLLDFDRGAVARVVEHGARLRASQRKLSTRLLDVSDLVSEASYWAARAGHTRVRVEDVVRAEAAKRRRSDLFEEKMQELITERVMMIETEGARVGRVNGLSILDLGDHRFGQPTRISASVSLGQGTLLSIEREIELSGPIHSKGFLTLSGYLAEKYAQSWPLALRASLTFEQSYDEVEGDSASSAELYALLSALSGVPLRQGIAVTGAIDQHGDVEAVGGVNEKVEGFFRVCRARGLTGEQGVVIPAANVADLMLDDEVVEAAAAGRFHVWAVSSVDEGLELLTGQPSGGRRDGAYPEDTTHRRVEERLRDFAERLRDFARSPDGSFHPRPRTRSRGAPAIPAR